jgi:glycolate oxidase iron-sulfur subunit
VSAASAALVDLEKELARCSRCGACRTVCPVFGESLNEAMVARGRIELLRAFLAGRLRPTRQLTQYLNSCVKCLRCASVCPSRVEFARIAEAVRDRISSELAVPILARLGIEVLTPNRLLLDFAMRVARIFQKVVPPGDGLPIRHLPMMFYGVRRIPRLSRRPVLQRYRQPAAAPSGPTVVGERSPEGPAMTVAFFVGCLQNYVFTDAAEAAIDLLTRTGVRVVVPAGQLCCGTPALSVGARRVARRLARANVAQFEAAKADAVVVACATCGSALKNEYPHLLGEQGRRWAERTYDLSEFLTRFPVRAVTPTSLPVGEGPGAREAGAGEDAESRGAVSYHDPCHLRWVQGVYQEPRELLARSGPYEELTDAERCCGLGGVFALFYPTLSEAIARRKLVGLRALEAKTVVTGCPGCRLQLEALLGKEGVPIRVRMLAEVLRDRLLVEAPKEERSPLPSPTGRGVG